MENQSSIKEIINNAMKDVRSVMDTDTVVGQPIQLSNGITVIPVSKVSMGFASGGLDLPASEAAKKSFGAGGGTGVTVLPLGFLTIYPEGRVEMIPVAPTEMGPVEQIADVINRAPEIIGRIRAAFVGDEDEEEAEPAEPTPAEDEVVFEDVDDEDTPKKGRKKDKKKK